MSLKHRSEEALKARDNKKRYVLVRFLATLALAVMAVYVAYTIISDNIAIRENQKRYNELVAQTHEVLENNEQINAYLENEANLDDYIENMAREKLDYANSNELIYNVIPASAE